MSEAPKHRTARYIRGERSFTQPWDCGWISSRTGVVVHGTHNMLVQGVTSFWSNGHCFYVEDGVEERNTFRNNFAGLVFPIGTPASGPVQSGQEFVQVRVGPWSSQVGPLLPARSGVAGDLPASAPQRPLPSPLTRTRRAPRCFSRPTQRPEASTPLIPTTTTCTTPRRVAGLASASPRCPSPWGCVNACTCLCARLRSATWIRAPALTLGPCYSWPPPPQLFQTSPVEPMKRPMGTFFGNTAHSTGHYWGSAGGLYFGGRLWTDSSTGLAKYSSGRNEHDPRDDAGNPVYHLVRDTKVWLANQAISHWGPRINVSARGKSPLG